MNLMNSTDFDTRPPDRTSIDGWLAAVHAAIEGVRKNTGGIGAVDERCEALRKYLREGGELPSVAACETLLKDLRNIRAVVQMELTANLLILRGRNEPEVRLQYAQGLVEISQLTAGIDVAEKLETDTYHDRAMNAKVHGLLGRAYKQVYVDFESLSANDEGMRDNLRLASQHYLTCYENCDPDLRKWPAINLVAVAERARIDGVTLPAEFPDGKAIAQSLVEELGGQPGAEHDEWTATTLGQAYLALGNVAEASRWFGHYINNPKVDAFSLNGTIRQLEEVWRLKVALEGPGAILLALKLYRMKLPNGTTSLTSMDQEVVNRASESGFSPEARLGVDTRHAYVSINPHYYRAVARICRGRRVTVGTGFLISGADLSDELPPNEAFVLTNSHVVGAPTAVAKAEEVVIIFDAQEYRHEKQPEYRCQIVWTSAIGECDATLLRLSPSIDDLEPIRLADNMLDLVAELDASQDQAAGTSQVYVISHPGGDRLLMSSPAPLVDFGNKPPSELPIYLHYRSPTEPCSSGAPVLERSSGALVGLHHAGPDRVSNKLPRLKGRGGLHECNEGIYIASIRKAIREHFARQANRAATLNAGPLAAPKDATGAVAAQSAPAAVSLIQKPRVVVSVAPLPIAELTRMLSDPRTTERRLAPYFKLDAENSESYCPRLMLNWDCIVGGKPTDTSPVAIVGLDDFLVKRRRLLFTHRLQEAVNRSVLRLVSDGDSWVEYPLFLDDLTDHLSRANVTDHVPIDAYAINCVPSDGSPNTLASVTGRTNLDRIAAAIEEAHAQGVVISAGGSRLFGPGLSKLVRPYDPKLAPRDYAAKALDQALDEIEVHYRTLFDDLLRRYPTLRIFTHGYDLAAKPTEGPFITAPLRAVGIPADLQGRVARLVLDRLAGMHQALARAYGGRVVHVDCRDAVGDDKLWLDELHPNDDGFARVAGRFRSIVQRTIGRAIG